MGVWERERLTGTGEGRKWVGAWEGTQGEAFHLDLEGSLGVYLAMKDGRERVRRSLHGEKAACIVEEMCVYVYLSRE